MIVVDTNVLMMIEERKLVVDFSEIVVLKPCYEELKRLSMRRGKKGRAARVALLLIEKNNVPVVDWEGNCDNAIVEYSKTHKCSVATVDEELIKRLRMNKTEVLNIKGKILKRGD